MKEACKENKLHIVPLLTVADPLTIAQNLIYELTHGEKEILDALGKLLEFNRNEAGQNITAIVATATLPVNRQPDYLFDEIDFARAILSHLSEEQIDQLLKYNTTTLTNSVPSKEIELIREVFGTPKILDKNEGNSFLVNFFRVGKAFAAQTDLPVPEIKPEVTIVTEANMAIAMLSMCLKKGYLPLMRHDGSHLQSGFNTTVQGEIYNQTYDLTVNALAQYGVVPTMAEQRLNRRVIYSFYGLPQKLKGLQRDWKEFVREALETWRFFLVRNPEYAEKWGLTNFVDQNMRMIKPDGTPIISEQTGEQQIPVIDYTDLAVLRYLKTELELLLTDEEVYGSMPYDKLYRHILESFELLSIEYVRRDGAKPVLVNGIYDACATNKNVPYGQKRRAIQLSELTCKEPCHQYEAEDVKMQNRRDAVAKQGLWSGYIIDCGQDIDKKMWISERAPCLYVLYPEAVTIYRVTLPLQSIANAEKSMTYSRGVAYLTDCAEMKIDSVLSQRNEAKILDIRQKSYSSILHDMHGLESRNVKFLPEYAI